MRVGERLEKRATSDIVGRRSELAVLRELLEPCDRRVAHIHGLPGIGKSTLLRAFVAKADADGAGVIVLDCHEIEPTAEGFAEALARVAGSPSGSPGDLGAELGRTGPVVLLALDGYEVLQLLDTWLRQVFVPSLPDNVRVVFAGRHRPTAGWRVGGWEKLSLDLPLEPLSLDAAASLLEGGSLDRGQRRRIANALRGHPLALTLARSMISERLQVDIPEVTLQKVMTELTELYLSEVTDRATRSLLEGASMVRRVTVPLLQGMFPELEAEDAYRRLERLTFTESVSDGLRLHDGVREPIASVLQARNPEKALRHRRDAWRALSRLVAGRRRSELWRYTADMLYLIENPVVREAFFPSGTSQGTVESATAKDHPAIRRIIEAHEGPEATACLSIWLDRHPAFFTVVRGPDGECQGFCCHFDPARADADCLAADPVTADWLKDLERDPVPGGRTVLFIRRWLSWTDGEGLGAVQAACWLDIKRTYMEMRPALQRAYLTLNDMAPYAAAAQQLGFSVPGECERNLDGRAYYTARLDFGSDSVDGWLANLAAEELDLAPIKPILDREARELVFDEGRAMLTPLEFGVLDYLLDRAGDAVSREELLREVWGSAYTGWSNKVDVVVAGLRRKLGDHAGIIETVRGFGYRYRTPEAE